MIRVDVPQEIYRTISYHLKPRELNFVGHIVRWVRTAKEHSLVYRVCVEALAIFASIALIASIIGIPFFLICYRELIRQQDREVLEHVVQGMVQKFTEQINIAFLQGRVLLFQDATRIEITPRARAVMVAALNLSGEMESNMSDLDVLRSTVVKYEDSITRFGFRLLA